MACLDDGGMPCPTIVDIQFLTSPGFAALSRESKPPQGGPRHSCHVLRISVGISVTPRACAWCGRRSRMARPGCVREYGSIWIGMISGIALQTLVLCIITHRTKWNASQPSNRIKVWGGVDSLSPQPST
eukprot:Gb_17254 [translate_table: standard]